MLDLKKTNISQQSESGFEFELKLPEINEPTGAFITVRGEQSPTFRNYQKKKFNEFKQKEQQAKRRGREVEDITLDEAEELSIEACIVRIISWRGIAEGKTEVPFNEENAKRILKEHPWIKDQVQEVSSNLAYFLGK